MSAGRHRRVVLSVAVVRGDEAACALRARILVDGRDELLARAVGDWRVRRAKLQRGEIQGRKGRSVRRSYICAKGARRGRRDRPLQGPPQEGGIRRTLRACEVQKGFVESHTHPTGAQVSNWSLPMEAGVVGSTSVKPCSRFGVGVWM